MISRHAFACLLGFAAGITASGQTPGELPQNLQGWSWTPAGVSSASPVEGAALAIPANAQLARTYPQGDLAVSVTTRPVVGSASQDWPVLELGNAAVVLSREGRCGNLTVVVGDNEPVAIPLGLALDEESRLLSPLTLSVAHLGDELVVQAGDRTWSFPMAATACHDVVFSAGVSAVWDLDAISVIEPSNVAAESASEKPNTTDSTNATTANGPTRSSGGGAARADSESAVSSGSDAASNAPAAVAAAPVVSTLEIFTPPSVRFGRADAVRAALAQTIQK